MHRSSPTKPLSTPNISPSYPIINTSPVIENSSPTPPDYNLHINLSHKNLHINLIILFLLAIPNYLHYLLPHISIIFLFLVILILTIPLMISPQCLAINQTLPSYSTTY